MNWWHKMRRIWVSVSPRVKPRKPGVASGETGIRDDASGLLKLRDDVKMCAYNDVQVMWNMLSKSPHKEPKQATAAAAANTQPRNSKCSKHRWGFTWRFPFWSDHTTSNSSLFR
ncbi:hypothetical protein AB3S75_020735 [Citrus x aurantiifolia]